MRLTILEYGGLPVSPPQSVLFSPPGATIGRSADNHLVLPDETRQISRLQAAVRLDDSGCYLKNLSSVCAIEVNAGPLQGDQERRLNAGDLICIGVYQLRVDDPAQALVPLQAEPSTTAAPFPVATEVIAAPVAQPEARLISVAPQLDDVSAFAAHAYPAAVAAEVPGYHAASITAQPPAADAADAAAVPPQPAAAALPPAQVEPIGQSTGHAEAAAPFNLDGMFGSAPPAGSTAFAGLDIAVASVPSAPVAEPASPFAATPVLPAPPAPLSPVATVAPVSLPPAAFWDSLVSEFAPVEQQTQFDQPAAFVAPLATVTEPVAVAAPASHDNRALADLQALPVDPLDLFAATPGDGASSLFADSAGVFSETAAGPLGLVSSARQAAAQPDSVPEVAGHFSLPVIAAAQPAVPPPVAVAVAVAEKPAPQLPAAVPEHFAIPAASAPIASTPAPAVVPVAAPVAGIAPRHAEAGAPVGTVHALPVDLAQQAPQLLGAFMEGAGLATGTATLNEAQFRQAGHMLAGFIGGAMDLLSSRTIIKREVKADLTMILDRENNPLKLLPDAQTVLKQMFGPPFPGFMSPEQAMDDAFHDLHAHQIGMLAGMRAALNQLLHDVSPELIARKTVAGSWYERMLPAGREGRAWLQYCALHQSMVNAVEEDFQSVFGNAFLAAYDAEVELYRQQSKESARC